MAPSSQFRSVLPVKYDHGYVCGLRHRFVSIDCEVRRRSQQTLLGDELINGHHGPPLTNLHRPAAIEVR